MTRFGDFDTLCRDVPSYSWCNLFYRQVQRTSSDILTGDSADASTAPVGVNPTCGILKAGSDGSLANIANIIVIALSIFFTAGLIFLANRRKAAVGRVELRSFLILYFLSLPLQLLSNGALLEQGSTAIVALTALHAGTVAALFWSLLANGLVATQVVEDGTMSSLIPFHIGAAAFFAATTYIGFDVALGITDTLGTSTPPEALRSIPLFVLTSVWPAAAAFLYLVIMCWIVLGVLNEVRPMWYYVLSAVLFVLSQLAYFLLSHVVCKGTNAKIDGSFIATLLETAAVGVLYLAWRSITEESWDEDAYYQ
ncbi:chitin synthase III catalytic subunit [Schizophyllum amplum]|uniref:Chitin synthase III catalytic subunit n=1 Tax=Schizophyllum amplum TaxID=97359 RepID=A0A550CC62_9AGAR|nr:chitin synthase III catalytic subunit [Auriculariopsis ampla]